MKTSKVIAIILTLSIMCIFSSVAYAGTLYTGPDYVYNTKSGQQYYFHLSASANTFEAPNKVQGNAYSLSSVPISKIETIVTLYNSNNSLLNTKTTSLTNTRFSSVACIYDGNPGTSYSYAVATFNFYDSTYGNYSDWDISDNLYW